MKVCYEMDLDQFKGWSGAENTIDEIISQGKEEEFENLIEELYPDGIDAVDLNDILRFEEDWLIETLDLKCTYVVNISDIEWDDEYLTEEESIELTTLENRVYLKTTDSDLDDAVREYLEENNHKKAVLIDFRYDIIDKHL